MIRMNEQKAFEKGRTEGHNDMIKFFIFCVAMVVVSYVIAFWII